MAHAPHPLNPDGPDNDTGNESTTSTDNSELVDAFDTARANALSANTTTSASQGTAQFAADVSDAFFGELTEAAATDKKKYEDAEHTYKVAAAHYIWITMTFGNMPGGQYPIASALLDRDDAKAAADAAKATWDASHERARLAGIFSAIMEKAAEHAKQSAFRAAQVQAAFNVQVPS